MSNQWSRKYVSCINCSTTEHQHRAKGLCVVCYQQFYLDDYYKTHQDELQKYKQLWSQKDRKLYPHKYKSRREKMYFDGNREAVLERDNNECQLCGDNQQLVVHHIDEQSNRNSEHPNNNLDNLITLCKQCHYYCHWHTRFNAIKHKKLVIAESFKLFIRDQLKDIVRTRMRIREDDRNDHPAG